MLDIVISLLAKPRKFNELRQLTNIPNSMLKSILKQLLTQGIVCYLYAVQPEDVVQHEELWKILEQSKLYYLCNIDMVDIHVLLGKYLADLNQLERRSWIELKFISRGKDSYRLVIAKNDNNEVHVVDVNYHGIVSTVDEIVDLFLHSKVADCDAMCLSRTSSNYEVVPKICFKHKLDLNNIRLSFKNLIYVVTTIRRMMKERPC